MSATRFIEIDGRRYLWRDILRPRREQRKALAQASSLLFSSSKRTAAPQASGPQPDATANRRCFLIKNERRQSSLSREVRENGCINAAALQRLP